jgi:hypothetical protein
MSPIDFGPFVRYVAAAHNLGAMFERANRALPYHQTGTELWVDKRGPLVRWSYAIKCPFKANARPFIDHILQPLINLVRL